MRSGSQKRKKDGKDDNLDEMLSSTPVSQKRKSGGIGKVEAEANPPKPYDLRTRPSPGPYTSVIEQTNA